MRFYRGMRRNIDNLRQGVPSSGYSIVSVDLRCLVSVVAEYYFTSGVVVPRMIRLHTIAIAVIPPAITITRLEMNIRDTLARGTIAITTLLRSLLQRENVGGL